jgi:uncharacterized protein YajQ (UPF0234 family)
MKKIIIISMMTICVLKLSAQIEPDPQAVQKGDILVINQPENQNFQYLNLPNANFIIKKGGIANYKSIAGNRVKVTGFKKDKLGEIEVILKRVDGRRFFSFPTITANLKMAIESGELSY